MNSVEPYAWAAHRDASWLNRPDVRRRKRWHVDRGDGTAACCPADCWSPRRNPMLDEHGRVRLAEVPVSGRCRRPGCRERWPGSPIPGTA